ncbi:hypothetical protein Tco_0084549 [Tanacetum coccineum]
MSDSLVRVSRRARMIGCPQAAGATELRAGAKHAVTAARCQPTMKRRHLTGYSTARALGRRTIIPHPVHAPSRSADRLTPFHIRPGRIASPHSLPSRQFQALFDSLFKVLFIFPSRLAVTCFDIGLTPVLALGRNLPPIGAAFPNNRLADSACGAYRVRARRGSSPLSGAPFQGDWPGPFHEGRFSRLTIRDSKAVRFSSWAVPVRSPLLRNPWFDNDPSQFTYGKLVRLLLPLMISVQWEILATCRQRTAHVAAIPNVHGPFNR